jgi:hypothetical protein
MKIDEKLKRAKENEIEVIEYILKTVDINVKFNRDYILKINDLRNIDEKAFKLLKEYIKINRFPMYLLSKYMRCLVTPNLAWCAHDFVNEVVRGGDTVDEFFKRWGKLIDENNKEWEEENGPL